jgi:hypothetical protein
VTDQFIQDDVARMLRGALATQGLRAIENPLSAAVVHEAGHAVLYAAYGHEVRSLKVWQKKRGAQRGHWVGFTTAGAGLRIRPDTRVESDFLYATIVLSGVLAEQMFDHQNFREASSLDEIAKTRALASNIALQTGAEFEQVMTGIVKATMTVLRANEHSVREIAAELERRKIICRGRLAELLKNVIRR